MSLVALKTHADNGLLRTKGILWIILPALAFSLLGTFVVVALPSEILRKAFGAFLIVLSLFTVYKAKNG